MQGSLFSSDAYGGLVPSDICAGKHGGNPNSAAANPTDEAKGNMRSRIVEAIRSHGRLSLEQLCDLFAKSPNALSGRLSELKRDGVIVQVANRVNRNGANEAVYAVSKEFRK